MPEDYKDDLQQAI